MEPTHQLAQIVPTLNELVGRISADDLNTATPCDKFTVHDVLDHMMVLGGTFAYWFRGETAPEISAPPVYGRVPVREFQAAMNELLDAAGSEGAMERTIATPMGEMSGEAFARFVALDGVVHGWDLATAARLDYDVPDEVVAATTEFAHAALTNEMRDGDTFKDATAAPATAAPIVHLAAFTGRSV